MIEVELDHGYNPHDIEEKLYHWWEESRAFEPSGGNQSYCIVIPPPNVTGSLHMGHAFQDTIMDALIRYHRMKGHNTLWQAGTDHAGIATQMVVERQLNSENQTRHDLGREKFIERVWKWKEESGGSITRQLRRMGCSIDWSRERFTMDEDLSSAVQNVFIELFKEGLIYRGKRLVNWDPILHTALSDLEVISEEEEGSLWHIRYPVADENINIVVATTRPETMLGDVAVAVHPDDDRYKHLIGKHINLPLTKRIIPIISDEYVDPDFGTGCLKITPAHDFNDYEVGKRHNLEPINILNSSAAIELPDSKYHGLDRYKAREKIISDLSAENLIDRIENHKLMVPRGDRSHAVVEPFLTDQWFVKMQSLADPAIDAVKNGDISFVPENWGRTYFEWMNNIQDWCISRQIWWGHRIPAWYDDKNNIYVGKNLIEAEEQAYEATGQKVALRQDNDVLDTWFSSALWPFSTLGWPSKTDEMRAFYPTSVLVTGFDIIFFWVARMIMFGLKFTGRVPFHQVYVHGLVRDSEGQKMSKSKGNVLDPIDLIEGITLDDLLAKRTSSLMQPQMAKKIEKSTRSQFPNGITSFGTDALRFTFASLATQGRDIRFDIGRIEGFRNFCNKLWNATRFVLQNSDLLQTNNSNGTNKIEGPAEKWIQSRLSHVSEDVSHYLKNYRFDKASQLMHSFTWDEYCSWYLEIAKIELNNSTLSDHRKLAIQNTLVIALNNILRLIHPIMPFITEALWQQLKKHHLTVGDSIMHESYPHRDDFIRDDTAESDLDWIKLVVGSIRNMRGEMKINPRKKFPVFFQSTDPEDLERTNRFGNLLLELAQLDCISQSIDSGDNGQNATIIIGNLKISVPLDSLIDRRAELERLDKQIAKLNCELMDCRKKLENSNFISRAPKPVVQKEKDLEIKLSRDLSDLNSQYNKIKNLSQ